MDVTIVWSTMFISREFVSEGCWFLSSSSFTLVPVVVGPCALLANGDEFHSGLVDGADSSNILCQLSYRSNFCIARWHYTDSIRRACHSTAKCMEVRQRVRAITHQTEIFFHSVKVAFMNPRTITRPVNYTCIHCACMCWLVHACQYYSISKDNYENAVHCGVSMRELHGALAFHSATFSHLHTSLIAIVSFLGLPHFCKTRGGKCLGKKLVYRVYFGVHGAI